jgi:hypothetical protein
VGTWKHWPFHAEFSFFQKLGAITVFPPLFPAKTGSGDSITPSVAGTFSPPTPIESSPTYHISRLFPLFRLRHWGCSRVFNGSNVSSRVQSLSSLHGNSHRRLCWTETIPGCQKPYMSHRLPVAHSLAD